MPHDLPASTMKTHNHEERTHPVSEQDDAAKVDEDFQESLFKPCEDGRACVDGMCCPYCQLGYQSGMLETGVPHMDVGVCLGAVLVDVFITKGIAMCYVTCAVRSKMRQVMHMSHDHKCGDCMQSFMCAQQAICQQHREMRRRGFYPGGVCTKDPEMQPPQPLTMQTDMNEAVQVGYVQPSHESRGNPPSQPYQNSRPRAVAEPDQGYYNGQPPQRPGYRRQSSNNARGRSGSSTLSIYRSRGCQKEGSSYTVT